MYKAVIFDWDGTLADTREAILFAFHESLSEIGINVTDEAIERRIGIGSAETFREILNSKNVPYDETLIRNLVIGKIQAEIDMSPQTHLFNGAKELLETLKNKTKLGLASMNNRQVIDHLLQSTQVKEFFAVTITGDEVTKPKPNPEIFLKTAQKLQTKPTECIVLEDSVFGVEAAKAANMACIAVTQGAYSKAELAKANPNLIVTSLQEKNAILNQILK